MHVLWWVLECLDNCNDFKILCMFGAFCHHFFVCCSELCILYAKHREWKYIMDWNVWNLWFSVFWTSVWNWKCQWIIHSKFLYLTVLLFLHINITVDQINVWKYAIKRSLNYAVTFFVYLRYLLRFVQYLTEQVKVL